MITDEDKETIKYFFIEKGDVTRWTRWDDKKGEIEKEFPELIDALKRLDIAERTAVAIVNNL